MSTGSDNLNLPQFMENVLPGHSIQHVVRQTISNSTRRFLSEEENGVHNMPRNNDDDEFDGPGPGINVPNTGKPPTRAVPTSGLEGNSTKHDNSVRTGKTNISSYNMRRNTVKNSFSNSSILVGYSESESTPPESSRRNDKWLY
jgi:hypothetical protein